MGLKLKAVIKKNNKKAVTIKGFWLLYTVSRKLFVHFTYQNK